MLQDSSSLIAELCALIGDLGKDGGLISPSVYDTAQVLRYYPPKEGAGPALRWLISQQQPDGGWGDPAFPLTRDVPTLAAILAIQAHFEVGGTADIVESGIEFLRRSSNKWKTVSLDSLPIAAEMTLPILLEDAQDVGLDIDAAPYQRLFQLRLDKQRMLQGTRMAAGSPATYSWETHAGDPDPLLLDSTYSIGHSPAATARWLRDAVMLPELSDACKRAEKYLSRASVATDTGIPGLMPNVWPISLFERTYGLYALLLAGLLDHPDLSDVVQENLDHIDIALREHNGLNFGETFSPDVDTTGVGIAVLAAMGREVDPSVLMQFECDGHFETFRGELNASVLSNAHAAHGLKLAGHACPATEEFLVHRQNSEGTWEPDKWHASWGYITLEVLAVLRQHHSFLYRRACQVLLAEQDLRRGMGQ